MSIRYRLLLLVTALNKILPEVALQEADLRIGQLNLLQMFSSQFVCCEVDINADKALTLLYKQCLFSRIQPRKLNWHGCR